MEKFIAEIFSVASEMARTRILAASRKISVAKGKLLLSTGSKADAAYILTQGDMAVEIVSANGNLTRVATLSPGELIGELGALATVRRTADVRALTACSLIRIEAQSLQSAVRADPDFAVELIRYLSKRIAASNSQIETLSQRPLRQRIAKLLIGLNKTCTPSGQILRG